MAIIFTRRILSAAVLLGFAWAGCAAPPPRGFGDPTTNGFPNPNTQQKMAIAQQAGGKLPGIQTPKSLGDGSATALQLIAFNELFESAYFTSLLNNLTNNAPGYHNDHRDELVKIFTTVQAQEETHAIAAISVLKSAGRWAPSPCRYTFPVDNLKDAVNLAETFTAVVLGALQDANVIFANESASSLDRILSAVIGQEGEQNGYYRYFLDRVPAESPFLTTVPGPFAYSALQAFIVPNSCPFPISKIALPVFPPIKTNGGAIAFVEPKDQTLSFSADLSASRGADPFFGGGGSGLWMTYTTGQQLPISVPLSNVRWLGSTITFDAELPFEANVMQGFSHGAITTTSSIGSADAVADVALAGPALIQVNNPL